MILSQTPGCNSLCGACHYKELTYGEQLTRKQEWAVRQLGAIGADLREIIPSPEHERLGYRQKSWLRTHFSDAGVSFGMYRATRPAAAGEKWGKEFISWDTCPIHANGITEMVSRFQAAFQKLQHTEEAKQAWAGLWLGSPHLVIVSHAPLAPWVREFDFQKLLRPPFTHVWFHTNTQIGRKIFGHQPIELLHTTEENPPTSTHPIRAFRQVAQTLLREARASAVRYLLESNPDQVIDLYCGTGDLSQLLPDNTGWIGIEHSSAAVTFAKTLKPATRTVHEAFEGAVENRLVDPSFQALLSENAALYLNPPRPGLGEEEQSKTVSLLSKIKPSRIAYLSCSASSLARDLAVLTQAGYTIDSLQPYDFFPQTEHFETLALLKRH